MKRILFRITYPKLLIFLCTIVIAYLIFHGRDTLPFHNILLTSGYVGTFISGFFYAYGFGAAPATSLIMIITQNQNIFLAAFIGGLGALLSDLFIFKLVKTSFKDEILRLERTKILRMLEKASKKIFGVFNQFVLITVASIFIASPLPTELGTAMLASLEHISIKKFAVIAFVLHTMGIFVIAMIGKSLSL